MNYLVRRYSAVTKDLDFGQETDDLEGQNESQSELYHPFVVRIAEQFETTPDVIVAAAIALLDPPADALSYALQTSEYTAWYKLKDQLLRISDFYGIKYDASLPQVPLKLREGAIIR
jgi:hypothetical protein